MAIEPSADLAPPRDKSSTRAEDAAFTAPSGAHTARGANAPSGALLDERELGAWLGFLRTHHELVARLDAELLSRHGLALTSYEVLMNLTDAERGRLRMSDLADRLLLSRSGLTRLVDRLEKQGLVCRERCSEDARGLYAVLTPAGERKVAAARRDHLSGVRRHFLEKLGPPGQEMLAGAWRRLAEH